MNRPSADRSCTEVVHSRECSRRGRRRRERLPEDRPSGYRRGYDKRWRRIRNAVLASEALYRHCAEAGRVTPAVLVDHIVPLPAGTHDRENLQPLCQRCHAVKTASERQ